MDTTTATTTPTVTEENPRYEKGVEKG